VLVANVVFVSYLQLSIVSKQSPALIDRFFGNETLLVTAHPDDETMFFGPLILSLVDRKHSFHILCLSNGSSDKSGRSRSAELESVVKVLKPHAKLKIIEDDLLTDGLHTSWSIDRITHHISNYLSQYPKTLTNLVTFDSAGVSGHPNHIALHNAVQRLSRGNSPVLNYYQLKSVGIMRKYTSFIDALATRMYEFFVGMIEEQKKTVNLGISISQNRRLRHLLSLHESQMLWFRKLYMYFSRYMFLNEFTSL